MIDQGTTKFVRSCICHFPLESDFSAFKIASVNTNLPIDRLYEEQAGIIITLFYSSALQNRLSAIDYDTP